MRNVLFSLTVLGLAVGLGACASSSDKSVKSNYMSQWTTVNADVKKTTAAAEAVLKDMSLLEIKSSATDIDGMASGKKANGSKVEATVTKEGSMSKVTVQVGAMGDPSLGTDIAHKIKMNAEGGEKKM